MMVWGGISQLLCRINYTSVVTNVKVFLKFERYHNVAYTRRRDGDACVLITFSE